MVSAEPLPAGKVTVAVEFTPDAPAPEQTGVPFAPARQVGGAITLSIIGRAVGSGHIPGFGNNTDRFDMLRSRVAGFGQLHQPVCLYGRS